jgi:hypothetical protein
MFIFHHSCDNINLEDLKILLDWTSCFPLRVINCRFSVVVVDF